MTQAPPTQHHSRQPQATFNHHNGHAFYPKPSPSRVRETVQKFDKIGKPNESSSPPPPLPPHRPVVPIPLHRNATIPLPETPPSSLCSSGDSMANEHMIPLPHTELERRRANETRRRMNGQRKSHVPTGPMINRFVGQQTSRRIARRSPPPPPIPPKTRRFARSQSASERPSSLARNCFDISRDLDPTKFAPYANRPGGIDQENDEYARSGSFEMYERDDGDFHMGQEFPKSSLERVRPETSSPFRNNVNRRASLMPFGRQHYTNDLPTMRVVRERRVIVCPWILSSSVIRDTLIPTVSAWRLLILEWKINTEWSSNIDMLPVEMLLFRVPRRPYLIMVTLEYNSFEKICRYLPTGKSHPHLLLLCRISEHIHMKKHPLPLKMKGELELFPSASRVLVSFSESHQREIPSGVVSRCKQAPY